MTRTLSKKLQKRYPCGSDVFSHTFCWKLAFENFTDKLPRNLPEFETRPRPEPSGT